MKKLLLLTFLGISIGLNAQYKSLFTDSAQYWTVYNWAMGLGFSVEYSDSLYLSNDTVFNNKSYKSVASHFQNNLNGELYGYLREDTSMGKAWFLKDSGSTENLIYDLSLVKGDTFQLNDTSSYFFMVDTVYYENARKHLRLTLLDNKNYILCNYHTPGGGVIYFYDSLLFIEGIGSIRAFDNRVNNCNYENSISDSERLLCAVQNGQKVFQHKLTVLDSLFRNNCGYFRRTIGTSIEEYGKYKMDFRIAPNPARGFFRLSINNKNDLELLKIMDLQGKEMVFSYKKEDQKSYWVDINNFAVGVYLLKVKIGKDVQFGKLVVNR